MLLGLSFFLDYRLQIYQLLPFIIFQLLLIKTSADLNTAFQPLLSAAVMLSYSLLTFEQPPPLYHNTVAELSDATASPAVPPPPPLLHCCWCLLRVFEKKRLSVVLLLVIVHLAEPVCAPARWLLIALLLPCRNPLLGHRRLRLFCVSGTLSFASAICALLDEWQVPQLLPRERQPLATRAGSGSARRETAKSDHQEVPWKTPRGGTEVTRFERKHLYGVLGICITTGITRKQRLADHWGLGPFDNYLLIRACMPYDLFMLFYESSTFLQVDPAINRIDRNHPAFGPEFANTIRDANRLFKK